MKANRKAKASVAVQEQQRQRPSDHFILCCIQYSWYDYDCAADCTGLDYKRKYTYGIQVECFDI